jgi:hypothetical protein
MYFIYVCILILFVLFLYKKLQKKAEHFENDINTIDEENIDEEVIEIEDKPEPINYGTQVNQIGVDVSNKVIENLQKSTVNINSDLKDKLKKYNEDWCDKYSKFYKFNEENKKHTEEYLYTNHDYVSGVYSPELDKCVSEIDTYKDNINCEDHTLNCYDEYDMLIENAGRNENKYGNPICAYDKCKYTCNHRKTCYDLEKQNDEYVFLEKKFKENCSLQQFNDKYTCNEKKDTSLCPNKDGFEIKLVNDKCTYIDKGTITEEQSKSIEEQSKSIEEHKHVVPEKMLQEKDIEKGIESSAIYVKPLVEEEYIKKTDYGAIIITKT